MKKITHLKNKNKPRIVDITKKKITFRSATAISSIKFNRKTFEIIKKLKSEKGEIENIATLAGIMAAKKTSALIPLCHNIQIESIDIDIHSITNNNSFVVTCTVKSFGKTGV